MVGDGGLARGDGLLQPGQHGHRTQRHVGGVHGRVQDAAALGEGLDRGQSVGLGGAQAGRGGLVGGDAGRILREGILWAKIKIKIVVKYCEKPSV